MKLSTFVRTTVLVPMAAMGLAMGSGLRAAAQLYNPIPLPPSNEITDTLSDQDIPTGFGGYARDYTVYLEAGDQVAIDLTSNQSTP